MVFFEGTLYPSRPQVSIFFIFCPRTSIEKIHHLAKKIPRLTKSKRSKSLFVREVKSKGWKAESQEEGIEEEKEVK